MSQIGSLRWRVKNYGVWRSLKYLYFDVFLQLVGFRSSWNCAVDDQETKVKISQMSGLSLPAVAEIELLVRKFLIDCQRDLQDSNQELKEDVAGEFGPVGRLTCIGAFLKSCRPDAYIETGTQYGVSAEFAYRFVAMEGLATEVISIDVRDSHVKPLNSGYRYLLLNEPYGADLVSQLAKFGTVFNKIIFAHDSDHTFEHMKWELLLAHRLLKPKVVVCDDVQQHRAFEIFCLRIAHEATFLRFENEPAYGVVSLCDPDGT
jgi:hypothetical protein